ncbi:MAG: hypothetical protein Q9191_000371 [Dirinaria sp. TL-2023a]
MSTPEKRGAVSEALAAPPPPGVIPNVQNPANLDNYVALTLTLCILISTIAFFVRMYTKLFVNRTLAAEDYVIVIAWISEAVPTAIMTRYGGGSHMWDVRYKDLLELLYATGVFSVISDFAILVLPLQSIWKLRMPLRKKLLISMVFATGIFTCASSILRTYYTWKLFESRDLSYYMVQMGLWAYAELATGVIISCLPIIPRFFQELRPKIKMAFQLPGECETSPEKILKSHKALEKITASLKSKLPYSKRESISSSVEPSNEPPNQDARLTREAIPFEEYATVDAGSDTARESKHSPVSGIPATRSDLTGSHVQNQATGFV